MSPKPKGVGTMIALGKSGAPPPRYKTPDSEPAAPEPKTPPKPPMAATPEPQPPAQDEGEDYGAKLTADIDAVFEGAGMDKEQGRQIAAQLFSAVAKCLGGESEPAAEPQMDDMSNPNSEGY